MAHFAEIDNNNRVIRVLVVPDREEHRGEEFLSRDLRLGGRWIQTSYNNRIRKQYAGIGFTYDPEADVFIAPQPYPSWVLNESYDWVAPVPYPDDSGEYVWNEELMEWENSYGDQ